MSALIIEKREGAVVLISLNRPERRNALSRALMSELAAALKKISKDPSVRVIILRGEGPVFCAGLDLAEAADGKRAEESARMVARTLLAVHESPAVVIAAVHGAAMAGGAGLMSACDLIVAAEETQIGYPETRRGMVAALVASFLCRQVGERHARELLLTGEPVLARRAWQMGLVNRVVESADLMKEARKLAESILLGGPEATSLTKKIIDAVAHSTTARELQRALKFHMTARRSKEADEGIRAFLEKRSPKWDR